MLPSTTEIVNQPALQSTAEFALLKLPAACTRSLAQASRDKQTLTQVQNTHCCIAEFTGIK